MRLLKLLFVYLLDLEEDKLKENIKLLCCIFDAISPAAHTPVLITPGIIFATKSLEYTRHIRQVCKVSIDLLTLAGLSTNIPVDKPADPSRCMVKLQTCGP